MCSQNLAAVGSLREGNIKQSVRARLTFGRSTVGTWKQACTRARADVHLSMRISVYIDADKCSCRRAWTRPCRHVIVRAWTLFAVHISSHQCGHDDDDDDDDSYARLLEG